jgi:phosphoglycerate dehydrogenase-like enzyme
VSKPEVVFWIGNRTKDLLVRSQDALKLDSLAQVNWAQAEQNMPTDQVCEQSRRAVAVISSWGAPVYSADILDGCPNLAMFMRIGGSLKGVIDPSAWERGIRVSSTVDAQGLLLGDLTLGLILSGLHRLSYYVRQQWGGGPLVAMIDKDRVPQRCLLGKSVGLFGFGAIAQHVARLLTPFGCAIRACDPYVDDAVFFELGVERAPDMLSLCEKSEVISLHAAHREETDRILSREAIALLRPGALVVNTSYGELIDMHALEDRLGEGTLFACLDMVTGGMPGGLDRLRHYPNCQITPTISGHSDGIAWLGKQAVEEVLCFLRGEPLQHEVTLDRMKSRA